jgi:tetratricopeptide (TPR) repeat protein
MSAEAGSSVGHARPTCWAISGHIGLGPHPCRRGQCGIVSKGLGWGGSKGAFEGTGMKICYGCGQLLAEEVVLCPSCGSQVGKGRTHVDDYEIEEILHEGHASILCKARRAGDQQHFMIRLFTPQSGVDEAVASRLKRELEELRKLPAQYFVRHLDVKQSWDGKWYRLSEWIEAENWGDLLRSGALEDLKAVLDIFGQILLALEKLHEAGYLIPHLTLNDIMVMKKEKGGFHVKLDYKLSRFLNPKLDRPPPMLKHLLSCHPDIINGLPLDTRSDIWSLGKIFVEILAGEFEIHDLQGKVEQLLLPQSLRVLLRTMLADDPDLRPRSVTEIRRALLSLPEQEIRETQRRRFEMAAAAPLAPGKYRAKRPWAAAALTVLAVSVGILGYTLLMRRGQQGDVLERYANQYAGSIAFVLVDYGLKERGQTVYRNRSEGTAFLVDSAGHLLTSRHVACPWLEDPALQAMAEQLRERGGSPVLDYRMYLWFEGSRAFNRAAALLETREVADLYFLESAFRSEGTPSVRIEGVARKPTATRQLIFSPLRDDFAVLRVSPAPVKLRPLPLASETDARRIPRLSRVITLGFPLGSRTQAEQVNVSVTRGSVRRSFEDAIHIDAALYGGNSGGPVMDERGEVIGIASGVATDRVQGLLPAVMPLWNLAMVLPISKAAAFLEEIRSGKIKWNGAQDFLLEVRLRKIFEAARKGRWAEAVEVAENQKKESSEPALTLASAVMHWCSQDYERASKQLEQYISMDPEGTVAKFMSLVLDWLSSDISANPYRRELGSAGWGSPWEFFGYLTWVLEGAVGEETALHGWDTRAERSWILWLLGIMWEKKGELDRAEGLLREALMSAPMDSWEAFLAQAGLESVQGKRSRSIREAAVRARYLSGLRAFWEGLEEARKAQQQRRESMASLDARLREESISIEERTGILEKILGMEPDNGKLLEDLAFLKASRGKWEGALAHARSFLARPGRENARRLTLGILEAACLRMMGRVEEALEVLEGFHARTMDPWHKGIAEALLGKRSEASLLREAAQSPEKLLTFHLALGVWAEASSSKERAVEEYREVLASFLDGWVQFDFARERLKALRSVE